MTITSEHYDRLDSALLISDPEVVVAYSTAQSAAAHKQTPFKVARSMP